MIKLYKIMITAITKLKEWFSAGKYPTGAQFASLLDSFRHKDDEISMNDVSGLNSELNKKCGVSWGREVQELLRNKSEGWTDLTTSGGSFIGGVDTALVSVAFGAIPTTNTPMDISISTVRIDIGRLKQIYKRGVAKVFVNTIKYNDISVYVSASFEESPLPDEPRCTISVINTNSAPIAYYKIETSGETQGVENEIPDEL